MIVVSRRAILALPLLLAACGDDEPQEAANAFPPLRYDYLPPLQLNVMSIDVQQRFIPSGVPPDVSASDPVQPVDALKAMARDRLQPLGSANKAVFAIIDATLSRVNDVIRGSMAVSLTIYDANNEQAGYATAVIERSHTGQVADLHQALYDITKHMMDDMNVEFEYQVRRNIKDWLTTATAPDTPVDQAPLARPGAR